MDSQRELREECLERLQSQETRNAFDYLICFAGKLQGYECFFQRQGYLLTYRYTRGKTWPFAFIINRNSLLFYFRKAGLANKAADVDSLAKDLRPPHLTRQGEIKVRLLTESDAKKLIGMVFGDAEKT